MDTLLNRLKIKHYKIRPRTPEHNGKVERSHRNDNERFYSYLKFYSLRGFNKARKSIFKEVKYTYGSVRIFNTKRKRRELEMLCA